jgi:hypothetical protein
MDLNNPPPGASQSAEILPAVLRGLSAQPTPTHPVATRAHGADALGSMLRGSLQWESGPATVTWTVTLASWLLLGLEIAAIFVTHAVEAQTNIFARILTWNYHPQAIIAVATIAALAMTATAVMTQGLRRANLTWLRVWIGSVAGSVLAVLAMFIALALGLLLLAIGIAIGVGILFAALASLDG